MIQTIIDELGRNAAKPEYDSHDVIFEIMARHPREYTIDLYSFVSKDDPIREFHAALGHRFLGFDSHEATDKDGSMNARGTETQNQKWRKKN